jgi:hypothetical protein
MGCQPGRRPGRPSLMRTSAPAGVSVTCMACAVGGLEAKHVAAALGDDVGVRLASAGGALTSTVQASAPTSAAGWRSCCGNRMAGMSPARSRGRIVGAPHDLFPPRNANDSAAIPAATRNATATVRLVSPPSRRSSPVGSAPLSTARRTHVSSEPAETDYRTSWRDSGRDETYLPPNHG